MSKERARRREEREREAAIRQAARAAEAERRERRQARSRRLRSLTTDRLPSRRRVGRTTGALARREQRITGVLVGLTLLLVVLVWFVRPDWPARLGVVLLAILVFPMVRHLLVARR